MIIIIKNKFRPLNHLLLPIKKTCHKGDFGQVMILEGHPQYQGASRLAAWAALRTGAGSVTLLVNDFYHPHPSDIPEFIKKEIKKYSLKNISCLIIGPGLGKQVAQKKIA